VVFSTAPADVGFLAAEKAKRTPIVGDLLTAVGAITFERPQDLKKKLKGKITLVEEVNVKGTDTTFKKDFQPGDTIYISKEFVIHLLTVDVKHGDQRRH